MFDFALTEEQKALQTMVREFVDREVKPRALAMDLEPDPLKGIPWDIIRASNSIELRHLALRKELGGAGQDSVTIGMCVEELARGDLGVSVNFTQHWKIVQLLQDGGQERTVEKYLIPLRDDPVGMMAIAFTEPAASTSDTIIPILDPRGGPKMSAVRDGDHVILNGMKQFISNGFIAHLYLIYARTDKNAPLTEGVSCFVVPRDLPGIPTPEGFTIGRIHNKMGERLAANAELIFENCRVPMEDMIFEWNTSLKSIATVLRQSNAYAGASALGVGWAAFERAVENCKTRIAGCVPIIEHANIAIELAEMYASLKAAQFMVRYGCWQADKPELFDPMLAKSIKPFCSDIAFKVAVRALQMFGRDGIEREAGLEKLVRDAVMFLHSDGANASLYRGVGIALGKLPYTI